MGDASRPSVPPLTISADGVKKEGEAEGATSINNVNVNNTDERPARRSIDVSMIKFPADVQAQLDNFETTYKRDPTDYKNLVNIIIYFYTLDITWISSQILVINFWWFIWKLTNICL